MFGLLCAAFRLKLWVLRLLFDRSKIKMRDASELKTAEHTRYWLVIQTWWSFWWNHQLMWICRHRAGWNENWQTSYHGKNEPSCLHSGVGIGAVIVLMSLVRQTSPVTWVLYLHFMFHRPRGWTSHQCVVSVVPFIGLWSEWNGILSRRHATDSCTLALTLQFWIVCLEQIHLVFQLRAKHVHSLQFPMFPDFNGDNSVNGSLFMFYHPGYTFKPNWRHDCQADFAEERCTRKILDGSHWARTLRNMSTLFVYYFEVMKSEFARKKAFETILIHFARCQKASKIGT